MNEHTPYEQTSGRKPDFIVEYEIDLDDAIKDAKPHQGMRVDFLYDGDDPKADGFFIIWPEILDGNGKVILDTEPSSIPKKGYANMWVIRREQMDYHQKRMKIGTTGTWWRGGRVAYVTVIQINAKQ